MESAYLNTTVVDDPFLHVADDDELLGVDMGEVLEIVGNDRPAVDFDEALRFVVGEWAETGSFASCEYEYFHVW